MRNSLTGVPFVRTTSCPERSSAPKLDRDTLTKEGYNIKSSAEWFVFVGVTSFLYSLAMLVVYVFMKHKYDNIVYLPLIDFVVTVLFALCWFIADIAWAKAISDIQHHTNTENVISSLESTCPKIGNSSSRDCQIKTYASYGSIIISCVRNCSYSIGLIWFKKLNTIQFFQRLLAFVIWFCGLATSGSFSRRPPGTRHVNSSDNSSRTSPTIPFRPVEAMSTCKLNSVTSTMIESRLEWRWTCPSYQWNNKLILKKKTKQPSTLLFRRKNTQMTYFICRARHKN